MKQHLLRALSLGTILAMTSSATAAEVAPPLTEEERKMVVEMQKQWQASGMPAMTDEQVAAWVERMRRTRIELMGAAAGMQAAVKAGAFRNSGDAYSRGSASPAPRAVALDRQAALPPAQMADMSTQELSDLINTRQTNGRFTNFEASGDGFLHDGVPHIDPDGIITTFGSDSLTGTVSYIVDTGGSGGLVKHHNVNSGLQPITIGQFQDNRGMISFRSVDGETAAGSGLIPTSRGVLVTRDHSVIGYEAGAGLQPRAVPRGFSVAPLQAGDVASTGYILLERIDSEPGRSAGKSLRNLGDTLRAAAGKSDRSDYALFNVATGVTVPLYVSSGGKTVGRGVNCRAKNSLVNKCEGWQSFDSIWDADGRPNNTHYYWSIRWFPSRLGPLAVALESGVREVNVVHLESGQRVNAFTRTLGISGFDVRPTDDGDLNLVAEWMFKQHYANALDLLATPPAALEDEAD